MSEPRPVSVASNGGARLRKGGIGVFGMAFMVVAFAAPLTAMGTNLALSLGPGVGVGTLGWMVLIGLLLAAFTAGYVVLARTVVSAGAYFAYIGHGLGRGAGSAAATVAFIGYNFATAALVAVTAYFTDVFFATYAGLDLPWPVYAVVVLALVGSISFVGVGIASKVTMSVSLLQFALLAALFLAVLVDRPEGFTMDGFAPSTWDGPGLALTIVFLILAFGGFETAAAYGEECEAPQRKIKQATYLSLGLLLVVFMVSTWTLIAAFDDVEAVATADPGAVLFIAASTYLGQSVTGLITATVAASFLAAAVSIHNMAARYGFALGRAGVLPASMARTHPRFGTPSFAIITQILTSAVIVLPFAISGADPVTDILPLVSGVTALSVIGLMAASSISVIVASWRGTVEGSTLATRVLPATAALGFGVVTVLIVRNYQEVTGSDSLAVALTPLVIVVGIVVGAVASRRASGNVLDAE